MTVGQRTALIGDIGGTHARFAICDIDELTVAHFAVFQTSMFSSLPDAVSHYLQSVPARPETAGFSVAAPLEGEEITMTNTPWTFTRDAVRAACGAKRIHFINDYEALALSLPYLNPHDMRKICGGEAIADAPKVVLGSGSGFGCAGLLRMSGSWVPVAGEAGHAAFGATNEREMAVLSRIAARQGFVSLQSVLSGRGLETIHMVLTDLNGRPSKFTAAIEIVNLALKDDDPQALESLEFFTTILGRIAGDMALTFGARGGVYIGGGVTPKILAILEKEHFAEAFLTKGRLSRYLTDIPVFAVLANDAGIRGTALAVSERFPMDTVITRN